MDAKHRTYSVTEAGSRALAQPSALSVPCRRILALLDGQTHYAVIARDLAMCAQTQVIAWLLEMESKGLLESQAAADGSDLDFTGSLRHADFATAAKGR
jgi:hypothetical protein